MAVVRAITRIQDADDFTGTASNGKVLGHNGTAWTPVDPPAALASTGTGPPSGTPAVGSFYTDTTTNWVYVYQSYGWQLLNPHLKYRANSLYHGHDTTNASTSSLMGNNTLRVLPKLIKARVAIIALQGVVAAGGASESGGTCRFVVYADSGDGKTPGSLLVEATAVAVDTVGDKEQSISPLTLNPGIYWFGGVVQGCPTTRPNMHSPGVLTEDFGYGAGSLAATGITGSCPSTFPAFSVGSAQPPLVRFRTQV